MRAAKTDANAHVIDMALYLHGATVAKTDRVGSGFPDRVVGFHGKNFLLEYKDGAKSPSKRKLNEYQQRWHRAWTGQVAVVSNAEEALEIVCGVSEK